MSAANDENKAVNDLTPLFEGTASPKTTFVYQSRTARLQLAVCAHRCRAHTDGDWAREEWKLESYEDAGFYFVAALRYLCTLQHTTGRDIELWYRRAVGPDGPIRHVRVYLWTTCDEKLHIGKDISTHKSGEKLFELRFLMPEFEATMETQTADESALESFVDHLDFQSDHTQSFKVHMRLTLVNMKKNTQSLKTPDCLLIEEMLANPQSELYINAHRHDIGILQTYNDRMLKRLAPQSLPFSIAQQAGWRALERPIAGNLRAKMLSKAVRDCMAAVSLLESVFFVCQPNDPQALDYVPALERAPKWVVDLLRPSSPTPVPLRVFIRIDNSHADSLFVYGAAFFTDSSSWQNSNKHLLPLFGYSDGAMHGPRFAHRCHLYPKSADLTRFFIAHDLEVRCSQDESTSEFAFEIWNAPVVEKYNRKLALVTVLANPKKKT